MRDKPSLATQFLILYMQLAIGFCFVLLLALGLVSVAASIFTGDWKWLPWMR